MTLSLGNNKGPDQPAHPCSLISAFIICYLKSKVIIGTAVPAMARPLFWPKKFQPDHFLSEYAFLVGLVFSFLETFYAMIKA